MLLLFIISIGLFVYGVLGKSYSLTEIGIQTAFNTRNFIFFGLIHYSIGCWFTQLKPNKTWLWKGLLLFTLGTTLHITELSLILHAHPDFNPIQDYLFSTILSGVGVALMALSEHPIVSSSTLLSKIGKESLGVFLIHFAVIDVITSLTTNDIVITIIGVPTTVIITYAIVTQVKKWFPRTRAFL